MVNTRLQGDRVQSTEGGMAMPAIEQALRSMSLSERRSLLETVGEGALIPADAVAEGSASTEQGLDRPKVKKPASFDGSNMHVEDYLWVAVDVACKMLKQQQFYWTISEDKGSASPNGREEVDLSPAGRPAVLEANISGFGS